MNDLISDSSNKRVVQNTVMAEESVHFSTTNFHESLNDQIMSRIIDDNVNAKL